MPIRACVLLGVVGRGRRAREAGAEAAGGSAGRVPAAWANASTLVGSWSSWGLLPFARSRRSRWRLRSSYGGWLAGCSRDGARARGRSGHGSEPFVRARPAGSFLTFRLRGLVGAFVPTRRQPTTRTAVTDGDLRPIQQRRILDRLLEILNGQRGGT